MTELAVLLGLAGVLLVMVGLLGGGFTFSGTIVPRVGRLIRLPCFLVGGLFVVLSVGLIVFIQTDVGGNLVSRPVLSPSAEPAPAAVTTTSAAVTTTSAAVTTTPVPPSVRARTATVAGDDGSSDVYMNASLNQPMGSVANGAEIQILCTAQGVAVMSAAGQLSTLWDFVTNGKWRGYLPDVFLDTGTDQATMPDCSGS